MKSTILLVLLVSLTLSANANSIKRRAAATLFKEYLNNLEASSGGQSIDLGIALKMYLTSLQSVMPCGFPAFNLPILAPLTVDLFVFDLANADYNITGNVSDIFISGLNDFQALKINYDEPSQTLSYDINFTELQLLAEYSEKTRVILAGFLVQITGDGIIDTLVRNMRLVGNFQIGTDPDNSNSLRMSNFHLHVFLGNAVFRNWNRQWDNSMNNFLNKFAGETMDIFVQQYSPDYYFQQEILPIINQVLQGVSMESLINFLVNISQNYNSISC